MIFLSLCFFVSTPPAQFQRGFVDSFFQTSRFIVDIFLKSECVEVETKEHKGKEIAFKLPQFWATLVQSFVSNVLCHLFKFFLC